MPKHFQSPVAQYKNVHEFQHNAIQSLVHLYGKHRKFTTFDFGEKMIEVKDGQKEKFYYCIGYQTGEQVPPEATPGRHLTEAQKKHEEKVAAQQKVENETGAGLVNATEAAIQLAVKKGVNLVEIAKQFAPGTQLGKKQVEQYIKQFPPEPTPEKDKVNETVIDTKDPTLG